MRCVRSWRAGVSNSIIFRYNVIIQLVFRDLPHLVRQKMVDFACGLPIATQKEEEMRAWARAVCALIANAKEEEAEEEEEEEEA